MVLEDIQIISTKNNLVKEALKLKIKKYRNKFGLFLVEGPHLVYEAFEAGLIKHIFYVNECKLTEVLVYKVSQEVMDVLSDVEAPQGIIAVCEKGDNFNLGNKVLLLDNVQDPGNIGTLIRSAVAFGFSAIVSENSVDYYNDKVVRATQGAIFKISLINFNLIDFIKTHQDYQYLVTDLNSDVYLEKLELRTSKIGVILGNEGQGVNQEVINLVEDKFKLQMEKMESLNVSVAGSIIMYELMKRSE